jgi:hypothetical protein
MRSMQSRILLVGSIILSLGMSAASAAAANGAPAETKAANAVEIYRQGHEFVVAVYHPDGSAALAVVEPAPVKRHRSRKHASAPSLDELMKVGRVKYTIRLYPKDTSEAEAQNLPILNRPAEGHSRGAEAATDTLRKLKLNRKQRVRLKKQSQAAARALRTASEALANHQ